MRASRRAPRLALLISATALLGALASAQEGSKPQAPSADSESEAQAAQALRTRWAVIDVSDAAFKKLDADHDGRISALEANANPKVAARFLDADKNHDGYLSPEEFRTLGELPAPPATPIAPSPKPKPNPDLP